MNYLTLKLNEEQASALYYALLDAFNLADADGRDKDRQEISDLLDKMVRE